MKLFNSMRKQSGIALITTLLLLLLMSAMLVGFIFLVTEGQRLSGLDQDQVRAFYAAESGMEKLTNDLGNLFTNTYSPTGVQVNALMTTPPTLSAPDGIFYQNAVGANGYSIAFPPDANGNPLPQFAQITSGSSPYAGMSALETTYTLTVEARTGNNADVKLTRTTQTVGIPLFQFGIFSQTDLSFFPGPNFNFGGRVSTNGNLFLDSGGPAGATPNQTATNQLWLSSPVTAVLDIFRDCLSNTAPQSAAGNHPGSVEITKGGGVFQALGFGQGSLSGCLGAAKNPNWPAISASFNGNLRNGVKPLNLTITLLGNGASQPIDIIRRPVVNENNTNPGVLGERYFSQASLRILLSDNAADITGLPCVSAGAPFNLADLALATNLWATPNATALKAAMTAAGTPVLPLAASGALNGTYTAGTGVGTAAAGGGDGYWQPAATKVLTGYIKIDAQTTYGSPCGTYKDVTQEILSLGYAGKNINPVSQSFNGTALNPMWAGNNSLMQGGASPALPGLPLTVTNSQLSGQTNQVAGVATAMAAGNFTGPSTNPATGGWSSGTCLDPHPNAVIRLERIRDNPSSVPANAGVLKTTAPKNLAAIATVAQVCGVDPATKLPNPALTPSDFWPNMFYDTREGYNRETPPTAPFNQRVTLGGLMNYIELDVNNLARWFSGTIGVSGPSTQDPNVAPNNFVVYVSDRRSNYYGGAAFAVWPPASPSGHETGEYGYGDFVNPADVKGCPNSALDTGEDVAADGVLYTYGETTFPPGLVDSTGFSTAATLFANTLAATVADPLCVGPNGGLPWPRTFLLNANEARENPNALFRRALKLVNGSLIKLPACPGGVSCGLTVATENPAYVQGDFNANSAGNGFTDPNVAASVVADAFTFLSNDWNDVNSFNSPFNTGNRAEKQANVYYRLGIVAGKGLSFPIPGWDTAAVDGSQDFGTDGGVHNFMRYLESWGGQLDYTGSIISLYYNRQAIGLFNSGGNNYSPPQRGYSFDNNFLNPTLLPPRTPMFRDVNTTGFTQLLLANQ
jgi:PilX N-terminal